MLELSSVEDVPVLRDALDAACVRALAGLCLCCGILPGDAAWEGNQPLPYAGSGLVCGWCAAGESDAPGHAMRTVWLVLRRSLGRFHQPDAWCWLCREYGHWPGCHVPGCGCGGPARAATSGRV